MYGMEANKTKIVRPKIKTAKTLSGFLIKLFSNVLPTKKADKIAPSVSSIRQAAINNKAKGIPIIVNTKNKIIAGVKIKAPNPIKDDCQFLISKFWDTS